MDKWEERVINDPAPATHGRITLGARVPAGRVRISDHQGRAARTIAADTAGGNQSGGSLHDRAGKHAHRNVAANLTAYADVGGIIRQAGGRPAASHALMNSADLTSLWLRSSLTTPTASGR